LSRVYFRAGRHPTHWNAFRYFGPTGSRFDHQLPNNAGQGILQRRGVLYAAVNAVTCLAEVFQAPGRTINRYRGSPWLVIFELQVDLDLLDLSSRFPLQSGASMKLMSGPSSFGRNWAQGFYAAYPRLHGLYYPSSLTNETAMVLNDRADHANALPGTPLFNRSLSDPLMLTALKNAAQDIGYDLI